MSNKQQQDQNSNVEVSPIELFSFSTHVDHPQFIEKNNQDWVSFGKDNLFPEFIKELSLKSTFHSSILKTKADILGGQGILNETEEPKLQRFIDNEFAEEDLETIVHRISQDLVIFNAYALLITWSKDGKQVSKIDYIDVANVRVGQEKDENGLKRYFFSEDWRNTRREKNKPIEFQEFSTEHTKEKEQILYVKESSIFNSKYYTLPSYYPATPYIEMENKVSEFKNNYIDNGFFAGSHIDMKQNPTPEEKEEIEKAIKDKFAGWGNSGKILLTFSSDAENRTEFTPIEMQFPDKFFEQTRSEIQQAILAQHNVTNPQILGIKIPGELGATDDLEKDIQQFFNIAIRPKKKLIERSLFKLARTVGIEEDIELQKFDLFQFEEKEDVAKNEKEQEITEEEQSEEEKEENNIGKIKTRI